jgi:purine nucleoside permease
VRSDLEGELYMLNAFYVNRAFDLTKIATLPDTDQIKRSRAL